MKAEKDWTDGEDKRVLELVDRLMAQKEVDVDKNWEQLSGRIRQEERRNRIYQQMRSVAAILWLPLLVLSGYLGYRVHELLSAPAEPVELTTAYGTIAKITLSDGSEVWLNSGSKLVYPKRFKGKKR